MAYWTIAELQTTANELSMCAKDLTRINVDAIVCNVVGDEGKQQQMLRRRIVYGGWRDYR